MPTDKKGFFQGEKELVGDCPICETSFQPEDITTVKEKEEITLLHASCSQCESAVMIGVIGSDLGVETSIGMLTDLTKEDIKRFSSAEEVSVDDVLNFHKFLKEQS